MTTFTGRLRLADGRQVDYSGTAPAKHSFLLGMTSPPGTAHNQMVAAFPGLELTAEFGPNSPNTTLPPWGSGKQGNFPGLFWFSWKAAPTLVGPWLDSAPPNAEPFYLTWHHEPHGDMTPALYRQNAGIALDIIESHPRRDLVLGFGPVVTRWWLANSNGNPADWWVDGMSVYGIDSYNDNDANASTGYRTPAAQFTKVRDFARSKGVPWGVREWGKKRGTWDPSGQGRCDAMEADVEWCQAQGDCVGMAWWNFGDVPPSSKIIGIEPEQTVFRQLLAQYGG